MDRMSALDASFLYIEDDIVAMGIGSCSVFEGPAPTVEELCDGTEARLALIPRYRQKVAFVPFDIGYPVWIDDPNFDITRHVHQVTLPAPGTIEQLNDFVAEVMPRHLDRDRPLWEEWLVDGLEDGAWALVAKVHHCMVDGVSGTGLLSVLLDLERDAPQPEVPSDGWSPRPEPTPFRLLRDALTPTRPATSSWLRPRPIGNLIQGSATWARRAASWRMRANTSLVGPIGPRRRWTWATAELADVKTIRSVYGGTVNDVVLAAISGGFRDLLLSRGESPATTELRSLVPVNARPAGADLVYDNEVSALVATLPVQIEDPIGRLLAVRNQMDELKGSHAADVGLTMTGMLAFVPPALVANATRQATQRGIGRTQSFIHTVTTNVPGPQVPLYCQGREMLTYLPYVPLGGGMRVGVAIVSYNGRLAFGISGDYETAADIDVLAHGIEDAIGAMLKAAS